MNPGRAAIHPRPQEPACEPTASVPIPPRIVARLVGGQDAAPDRSRQHPSRFLEAWTRARTSQRFLRCSRSPRPSRSPRRTTLRAEAPRGRSCATLDQGIAPTRAPARHLHRRTATAARAQPSPASGACSSRTRHRTAVFLPSHLSIRRAPMPGLLPRWRWEGSRASAGPVADRSGSRRSVRGESHPSLQGLSASSGRVRDSARSVRRWIDPTANRKGQSVPSRARRVASPSRSE